MTIVKLLYTDAVGIVAGGGAGPIHIRQLECSGIESRITDCLIPDFALISFECLSHDQDAGVICSPGELNGFYITMHSCVSKTLSVYTHCMYVY